MTRANAISFQRDGRHSRLTSRVFMPFLAVKVRMLTEGELRDALSHLHEPHRLDTPTNRRLLDAHGRMPSPATTLAIGKAVADLFVEKIEALRPPPHAERSVGMPHRVLRTCFVERRKLAEAAADLGVSERQLTRERGTAIEYLRQELAALPFRAQVPMERIPDTTGLVDRPHVMNELMAAAAANRRVSVTGQAHVGKTSLVAGFVRATNFDSVFWLTFRIGINVSLSGLLWELGNYLSRQRNNTLAEYLAESLPRPDMGIATRLALQALDDDSRRLLVLDDYQLAETAAEISAFVDELVSRVAGIRVITIGTADAHTPVVDVPPLVPRPQKRSIGGM